MKGIFALVAGSVLFLVSAASMAHGTMHSHWTCTSNASSEASTTSSANNEMKGGEMKKGMSAKEAFKMALKHCRDCTKITCEAAQ